MDDNELNHWQLVIQTIHHLSMFLLGIVGVVCIGLIFFYKVVWFDVNITEPFALIDFYILLFTLPPLLLLAIFQKTRGYAAAGIAINSNITAFYVWMWSLAIAKASFGWIGVGIGAIIAGVGIVPIGVIGAGYFNRWDMVTVLLINIAIIWVLRFFAFFVAGKTETPLTEEI